MQRNMWAAAARAAAAPPAAAVPGTSSFALHAIRSPCDSSPCCQAAPPPPPTVTAPCWLLGRTVPCHDGRPLRVRPKERRLVGAVQLPCSCGCHAACCALIFNAAGHRQSIPDALRCPPAALQAMRSKAIHTQLAHQQGPAHPPSLQVARHGLQSGAQRGPSGPGLGPAGHLQHQAR